MVIPLYIGKFQPLHNGHTQVIKELSKKYKTIKIALGSADKSFQKRNPFTKEERIKMIKQTLRAEKIKNYKLFVVPDIPDDNRYVKHVEKIVGKFNLFVCGKGLNERLFIKKYQIQLIKKRFDAISATKVRNAMRNNKKWKHFVPKQVAKIIESLDGKKRIKEIYGQTGI